MRKKISKGEVFTFGGMAAALLCVIFRNWADLIFTGFSVLWVVIYLYEITWPKSSDDIFAEKHRVDRNHPSQYEEG